MFASQLARSFLGCSKPLQNSHTNHLLQTYTPAAYLQYVSKRHITWTIVYADPKDVGCSPEERALLEALNDAGVNPNHILNYRTKNSDKGNEDNDALDDLMEELDDPWMRNPMELPNFGFEEFTDLTPDALKEVVAAGGGGKVPSPYAAFTDDVKEEEREDGGKSQGFMSYKDFIANNNNNTVSSLPLRSEVVVVVLIDVRRREEHQADVEKGLLPSSSSSSSTISPIVKNIPLEELSREEVRQLLESRNEEGEVRIGIVDSRDLRAQQACVRLTRVFGVEGVVMVNEWRGAI